MMFWESKDRNDDVLGDRRDRNDDVMRDRKDRNDDVLGDRKDDAEGEEGKGGGSQSLPLSYLHLFPKSSPLKIKVERKLCFGR